MSAFAFLPLLAALIAGFVLGVWICRRYQAERLAEAKSAGVAEGQSHAAAIAGKLEMSAAQVAHLERELEAARREAVHVAAQNASLAEQQRSAAMLLEAERSRVTALQEQLPQSFKSVAADVLGETRHALEREFAEKQKLSGETLEQKEAAIQNLLSPIREALGEMATHTRELEQKRAGAYADIKQQIEAMQKTHLDLRTETRQLVSALRNPRVRGSWGEMQLRRCIEFAGMLKHCDFVEQRSLRTDDDSLVRPDVVVKLPNQRIVLIDSKVPLDAFLSAMNTPETREGDEDRRMFLQQHARQLREHLKHLDKRNYGREFAREGSPELVVCFLPSEVLLSAALEQDASLIEFSSTVVLATPTTLIALLKAVQCGWQNLETARNAEQIREQSLKIYEKLTTATDKIASLGSSLKSAVNHFNGFLATVQGRGGVFSIGRKLQDLQVSNDELRVLEEVTTVPDQPTHDDWLLNVPEEPFALAAGAETAEN